MPQKKQYTKKRKQGWELRDTTGKMTGVYAIQDFGAGDEVWSEAPMFKFEHIDPIAIIRTLDQYRDRRTKAAREAYFGYEHIASRTRLQEITSLIDAPYIDPGPGSERLRNLLKQPYAARSVAKAWYFRIQLPTKGGDTYRNFISRFGSRLNHSCVPNCWMSWNESSNVLHTYAIRNIKAGEELLLFYDVSELFLQKREARIQELRARYDFECVCPACDLDKGEYVATRRDDLADVVTRIRNRLSANDATTLDRMYRETLNLLESKSDGWEKGKVHLNLANVYEQKGSEYHVEARNQFERARKLAGRCLGKDSEEVKETQGSIERLDRIKYAAAYQLLTLQDRELDRMKAIANNTGYQRST